MHSHSERRISKYDIQQLFDLIVDIENYPKFIPWCVNANIISQENNIIIAELTIKFKFFIEKYTSRVVISPPNNENKASVKVEAISGPFEHLTNNWQLTSCAGGKTEINFDIHFTFYSKFLEVMIGLVFQQAVSKMITAFEERAEKLYQGDIF